MRFQTRLAFSGLTVVLALVQGAYAGARPRPVAPGDQPAPPPAFRVSDFELPRDGVAFHNYSLWRGSHLPGFLQVAHCTGMALLARQVHNHAVFAPEEPRLSAQEYERLLRAIYGRSTWVFPGGFQRVVLPGYAGLHELSGDAALEEVIKNVLGDALADAQRSNFNWSPTDVLFKTHAERSAIELQFRRTLSKNRVAITYLTSGTATAHAVLLYAYEVQPSGVRYWAYDSNWPGQPMVFDFDFARARFNHPDWGWRDPWVLHPYADERGFVPRSGD